MHASASSQGYPLRMVTATSLFDGHDVSVNLFRRMLQEAGVEVIHLGHNRSVDEIVSAVVSEDVHGVAVSSYQGGHMEFFSYLLGCLKEKGREEVCVFGGGGGVISPPERRELESLGVKRIFTPEDGASIGLGGIVGEMVSTMGEIPSFSPPSFQNGASLTEPACLGRLLTLAEEGRVAPLLPELPFPKTSSTVIGVTGTGGAGKSTLIDELLVRLSFHFPELRVGVLCCDPTRKKTGGALLGDRLRMNSLGTSQIFMRSFATRHASQELPETLGDAIEVMKRAGFHLIFAETSGIGQAGDAISSVADVSVYVMTPEFGAETQLEKIGMMDFADAVVVNKLEKRGGEDALRLVAKQMRRNLHAFEDPLSEMPVFGTTASRFQDAGVSVLFDFLSRKLGLGEPKSVAEEGGSHTLGGLPSERVNHLAEARDAVASYHQASESEGQILEKIDGLCTAAKALPELETRLLDEVKSLEKGLSSHTKALLHGWDSKGEVAFTETLSGTRLPRVATPGFKKRAELYRFLRRENLPGFFPFTAGVFPLKREDEDPTRMFAGEGTPERTNRRFHLLARDCPSNRLSTAFDSVTLYGRDPDRRPDIYGKIGNAGVSVATLGDMKKLYRGFRLCAPDTSVSMTINGPAPIVTAMFFNTAMDQEIQYFEAENKREATPEESARIRAETLTQVRGTVQADILKEDQGQNTALFSMDFSLKLMGDVQAWCIENEVRRFYPISISGYHIAEAGANPITQLAFTLANGLTYLEYFKARGLPVDEVARRFSFFFSNGMDAEYTVIGRVARRIWAIVLKEMYGANDDACKLKYHIQTSGRSLHSREMQFNDIRTTLQALCAITDHCNSLHTNAFDEALTTPTEASVRRALAIQMIIQKEWGLTGIENLLQGSYAVEELTDKVEEAVLEEFGRLARRGGVLGAMETGYQRAKIQDESMLYEMGKNSGSLPIIGVNTFMNPEEEDVSACPLARSTTEEKESQIQNLEIFHKAHEAQSRGALESLHMTAVSGGNIFSELMETVKTCSLGQITETLFAAGGRYRRQV